MTIGDNCSCVRCDDLSKKLAGAERELDTTYKRLDAAERELTDKHRMLEFAVALQQQQSIRADRIARAALAFIRCGDECEHRVPLGSASVRRTLEDCTRAKRALTDIIEEAP